MISGSPEHTIDGPAIRFLLALARETIQSRLNGLPLPSPEPDDAILNEPRGAFVTLKIDGRLRGCIGHVIGVAPLWRAVRDNAIAAAFEDPRFAPLEADELPSTKIEISALTPLRPVVYDEVIVGRDGILLENGISRGLLLPQVAVEYGWDRETFLDHTCRKAGLEPGCWRDPDTVISTFSAQVFGEEER
ncbi:MAG: AmmeMemoRadiSam system protein A [Thermoanaerobaculales bacterium]|nr:AmmeMemoRadiSam system protein A [Thermoanaerobaculales bacterium]